MLPINNLPAMLNALKSNPGNFLGQRGISLAPGMTDPRQIVNSLVQSGRVSQAQVNQAYQMARQYFPSGAQGGSFENTPKGT